jgi:hypothetical protein
VPDHGWIQTASTFTGSGCLGPTAPMGMIASVCVSANSPAMVSKGGITGWCTTGPGSPVRASNE